LRENGYPDAGLPCAHGVPSQRTSRGILFPFDTLMFQDSYTGRPLHFLPGTPAGFGHPLGVQDLETPRVLFHTRNVLGVPLTEPFALCQSLSPFRGLCSLAVHPGTTTPSPIRGTADAPGLMLRSLAPWQRTVPKGGSY